MKHIWPSSSKRLVEWRNKTANRAKVPKAVHVELATAIWVTVMERTSVALAITFGQTTFRRIAFPKRRAFSAVLVAAACHWTHLRVAMSSNEFSAKRKLWTAGLGTRRRLCRFHWQCCRPRCSLALALILPRCRSATQPHCRCTALCAKSRENIFLCDRIPAFVRTE